GTVGGCREAVGEPAQKVAPTGVGGAADQLQVVGVGPHELQVVPRLGRGHMLERGQVVAVVGRRQIAHGRLGSGEVQRPWRGGGGWDRRRRRTAVADRAGRHCRIGWGGHLWSRRWQQVAGGGVGRAAGDGHSGGEDDGVMILTGRIATSPWYSLTLVVSG